MTSNILFDEPGPRTRARHRTYSVVASLALTGLLGFVVWRLYGEDQFAADKWEVFVTPRYVEALASATLDTLTMAASSIVGAVVLGLVLGVGKLSDHWFVRWPAWLFVEFFRAVPVLLMMIFIYFSWGVSRGDFGAYWSVVAALTLYNGAVLAEVFRAGVLAVPRGQAEAAYALGLRKTQTMNLVLLPQAVKIMLPAIIGQCVVALKDTSLGYAITAPGLVIAGRGIFQAFNNQIPVAIVVAAVFIIINLLLGLLATWVQKRFVGERKALDVTKIAAMGAGRP